MKKLLLVLVIPLLMGAGCTVSSQVKYDDCVQECKTLYNMTYLEDDKGFIKKANAAILKSTEDQRQRQGDYNNCLNICVEKYK
jgi:hypothetical protein